MSNQNINPKTDRNGNINVFLIQNWFRTWRYNTRYHSMFRNSRQVFCKKDVLRNFAKFTEKHLCQGLFLNKVTGLRPATFRPATLLKKRL